MPDPSDIETIPPPLRATALGRKTATSDQPSVAVRVDSFGLSDRGKVRKDNQDHFYMAKLGRFSQTLATSLPAGELPDRIEEAGYVAVVADGMGGHAAGEVASRTTMTLTYSIGLDLFLAHVGDSRAYLCRNGSLRQLTRDHTRVQTLVDAGVMTREEATTHRLRNVLTNVLGGGTPLTDVEVHRVPLAVGDIVLLCSDGLHGTAKDEEIASILARTNSAEAACRSLVDLALERGAKDNVTAVVTRYESA